MDAIDLAFESFPTLETAHLRLREITPDDAEEIFAIFGDEEITRYYDLYTFRTLGEAYDLIDYMADAFTSERQIRWGIERKADGLLVGTCGFVWLRPHRGEIGYDLARACWGQGIMAEALGALLEYGFRTLDLNRIEALTMVENERSARLLRRLGFTEEALLREYDYFKEAFHDMRLFAMLRREFRAGHAEP